MKTLLITDARIVNEGRIEEGDIYVKNGRIERIGGDLAALPADTLIQAQGKTLMPGMIDDQVHFREPGMPDKADIATESRAAVAGGITSYMDMPNTLPNAISCEVLEQKYALAAGKSLANYSFYMGAANNNIEQIRQVNPQTVCGIKAFMGASTGNMLVDDPKTLDTLFADAPTLIATHCEDTPTILANEAAYRERYGEDIPMACHPLIRSEEACYKSSSLAVELAKKHGTRLHVLHISTAKELEHFHSGPLKDKRITAEACVHFLHFDERDYADKGALIKCNPAIKTSADREGIFQGLLDGRLDVIGTDHAPHTWAEKQNSYFTAPSGLPLVQHALLSLLEHYHQGRFSLEFIAQKTSHAVAELFHIENRGYIREGYWADLVLIDLNTPFTATRENTLYKCGWSPFEGTTFTSSIHSTVVNGHLAYQQGRFDADEKGHRLHFNR